MNIGINGSQRDLLHGTMLGLCFAPEGLRLFVAEPKCHGHEQLIPHGISCA